MHTKEDRWKPAVDTEATIHKSPAGLLAVDEDGDENIREEVQRKDADGRRKPSGRINEDDEELREREEPQVRGTQRGSFFYLTSERNCEQEEHREEVFSTRT